MTENEDHKIIGKSFNWEPLYGKLESGKYEFTLFIEDIAFGYIKIKFNIDENGDVTYENPVIQ